jgi:hypothetical protein
MNAAELGSRSAQVLHQLNALKPFFGDKILKIFTMGRRLTMD